MLEFDEVMVGSDIGVDLEKEISQEKIGGLSDRLTICKDYPLLLIDEFLEGFIVRCFRSPKAGGLPC